MAALSLFQQARKLKTANWGKKVCSQFYPKIIGCQPKNIFSIPAYEYSGHPTVPLPNGHVNGHYSTYTVITRISVYRYTIPDHVVSTIPCLISANFLYEIYDDSQSEGEKEDEDKDETDTKEDV